MNLNELKKIVDLRIAQGDGELLVVTGDINGYIRATVLGTGQSYVEDFDEYIMESVDYSEFPVFVVGE